MSLFGVQDKTSREKLMTKLRRFIAIMIVDGFAVALLLFVIGLSVRAWYFLVDAIVGR